MCLYPHSHTLTSVYGINLIKEQRPDLSWKYETADSKLMKLSYNNGSVLPAPSARLLHTDSKCKVCSLHLNITVHELFSPKIETFYISPVSPVSYLEFKAEVQLHKQTSFFFFTQKNHDMSTPSNVLFQTSKKKHFQTVNPKYIESFTYTQHGLCVASAPDIKLY